MKVVVMAEMLRRVPHRRLARNDDTMDVKVVEVTVTPRRVPLRHLTRTDDVKAVTPRRVPLRHLARIDEMNLREMSLEEPLRLAMASSEAPRRRPGRPPRGR